MISLVCMIYDGVVVLFMSLVFGLLFNIMVVL